MNTIETLISTTLRIMPPILLAGLGGMLSARAGLVNMGLEGMMLLGAFVAVITSYWTGSALMAVLVTMIVGGIMGLLFAVFVIRYKANNIVVSVAINMLALGITKYLLKIVFGVRGAFSSERIVGIPKVNVAFLEHIPVLRSFNNQSVVVYLSLVLVAALWYIFYKTTAGLRIRAAGSHAMAVKTAGIDVIKLKYAVVSISGVLCGLGGAHLSLGQLTMFTDNITNGRGFIAMAAAVFGNNTPLGTFLGSLLFSFTDAATMGVQTLGFPAQLIQTIPYVISILTLIAVALRQNTQRGFVREEA